MNLHYAQYQATVPLSFGIFYFVPITIYKCTYTVELQLIGSTCLILVYSARFHYLPRLASFLLVLWGHVTFIFLLGSEDPVHHILIVVGRGGVHVLYR
jgi:hypothetical protein